MSGHNTQDQESFPFQTHLVLEEWSGLIQVDMNDIPTHIDRVVSCLLLLRHDEIVCGQSWIAKAAT